MACPTSPNFLRTLSMVVPRSSYASVAIRYVLPVLLCFFSVVNAAFVPIELMMMMMMMMMILWR